MSTQIAVRFTEIAGNAAGLGLTAGGKTVVADRPVGKADGQGLGFNGGELLAAALGGCFWNDLHYAAAAEGVAIRVEAVEAAIELAGSPSRIARARISAWLTGNDEPTLDRVFDAARDTSTIANSLAPAFPIQFDRQTGDDA